LKDTPKAIKAYEDCLAINPLDNVAKQELEKLRKPSGITENMGGFPFPGIPGRPGGGPMPNLMDMINNPQFMEMASQLVQNNPQFMQMAQQVAQNPQMVQQLFGANAPDMSSMFPPPTPPPNQ